MQVWVARWLCWGIRRASIEDSAEDEMRCLQELKWGICDRKSRLFTEFERERADFDRRIGVSEAGVRAKEKLLARVAGPVAEAWKHMRRGFAALCEAR